MTAWFLINSLLAAWGLLFVGVNQDCPQRVRFFVAFMSLVAWVVPWPWLMGYLPGTSRSSLEVINLAQVALMTEPSLGPLGNLPTAVTLFDVFVVACVIGTGLYLITVYRHRIFLKASSKHSVEAAHLSRYVPDGIGGKVQIEIRSQTWMPGAWNSGIFRPVIWVHADLEEHPDIAAVILHESMHIKHRDNLYLGIITLLEKVFWWNPLVACLGKKTRELQELSCDEACQSLTPGYRGMLNNLILYSCPGKEHGQGMSLMSTMFQKGSFNVKRIKILKRVNTMTMKQYISITILFFASMFTVGLAVAQDVTPAEQVKQVQEIRRTNPDYEMTTEDILAGMEVYAANLEKAWGRLRDENQVLRSRIAELEKKVSE